MTLNKLTLSNVILQFAFGNKSNIILYLFTNAQSILLERKLKHFEKQCNIINYYHTYR